ncbi:MAG: fibronectin type III domain-containing protein [Paludibacteraceae bacterium]|nr:fibronectin type III domain-containing protein [Paludibacteraceae bacterium]
MKTLFQIKETSASSVRHCCRVLSLIAVGLMLSNTVSAEFYLRYNNKTNENNPTSSDFEWSSGATPVSNICTWTISCKKYQNTCVFFAWPSASTGELKSIATTGGITKSSSKIDMAQYQNYSSKNYLFLKSKEDCSFKIEFNQTSQAITISDADTPGPTPGGDALPVVKNSTMFVGTGLQIVITGYSCDGSATYNCNDDFTLVPDPNNADFKNQSDIPDRVKGNASYAYYGFSKVPSSGVNKFTLTHTKTGDCAVITMTGSTCTKVESCSASPTPEVSITSVDAGNGQLTVNWSVTGITPTSQTVQYKSGSGAYQNGPAVAANATSATITGLTNGTEYTIKVTATYGTDSPFAEQTGTPAAPTPGGGVIPITSSTKIMGDQLWIYIDGYPDNEYKTSNDYVVTTVSGTEVKELQSKTGSYLYVVLKAASASGTHEFKIQDNTTNTCAKFTIVDGSYDSHQSCIDITETPIVYWEKYPTIGNNTIDMFGYLAERWCSPVTDAGFYWKETNDITASDIETPATNHKFQAAANPAKNNDSFSRTTPDLSTIITEPTTIYLVNYVTTAGGGTGISDVVALAYSPCFPIPEGGVTFNNDEISLPQGYKFTFEVTARSAGKTPVYKWYLDDSTTPIEGAAGNTYEFTMPNTDPHTIKVEVTGDCEVSREATANITSCTMPAVTLAAETSTTPWTDVIITATPTAVASAEWSVEPKAELKNTSTGGATFRAGTPGTYTVKYVGASSACDATVNAEAEIEITVNADSEDCVNPNAE